MSAEPLRSRAECIAACEASIEAGFARQNARTPRDAAIAALGPEATEQELDRWMAVWRPNALPARSTA